MIMENLKDIIENIERENRIGMRIPKRYIRDKSNPFEHYYEEAFTERFKFSKDVVLNLLLPIIEDELKTVNNRGLPIAPEIQVLIALRFYASGSYQAVVGDLNFISQLTTFYSIHRVSRALASNLQYFVKFPEDDVDQMRNIKKFYDIAKFPNVATLIDGVLIKIFSPKKNFAEIFRCRKGWFALNVMAAVGPRGEFQFIDVRHPGSAHDQTCFDRSALKTFFEQSRYRGIILGDNGYQCQPYLLTPVENPMNQAERKYNSRHKKTRNLIERTYGRWKRKFSCLQRGLLNHVDNCIPIICATAVLWNIHLHINHPHDLNNHNYDNAPFLLPNPPRNVNGLDYRLHFIIQNFT